MRAPQYDYPGILFDDEGEPMDATKQLPEEAAAAVRELLRLPPEQRLDVSEQLIASVSVEQAWVRLAARRAEELKSGKVAGVPIDAAFDQARRAVDAIRPNAS